MKKLGLLGAFALLPFLGGCFNFEQSLTIQPNGTVTLATEFAIATDMMTMAFPPEEGGMEDFCALDPEDNELPPTFTVTTEQLVEGTDTICRQTAVGPIADLAKLIEAGGLVPGEEDETSPVITLVDEGGGVFTFNVTIFSQGEEEAAPEEAAMMAMIAAMFEGRTLAWTVTAPRLIQTNTADNVVVNGNTVTMTIPALELFTEPGIEYNLSVRFGLF